MPELSSTVRFTLLRTDLSLPDREAHPLLGAYAAFVLLEAAGVSGTQPSV